MKQRKTLRIGAIVTGLVLLLTACGKPGTAPTGTPSATPKAEAIYQAGSYTATADGHNGPLTLSLTVSDSAITEVKVDKHTESAGISDPAIERIPTAIVEGQTLAVDAIAGCTVTSKAILAAAEAAIIEAGGNPDTLKEKATADEAPGKTIELTTDVVVIGAGGAGFAAGITAHKAGADVIILEKMASVGGNTILAGGALNAPDPERQAKQEIEDSIDLFYKQTMEGGDNEGNPELVHKLCDESLDAVHWLEEVGVVFREEFITVPGGLHPRGHATPPGKMCVPWFDAFKSYCTENNVEIMLETRATELLMEGGKIVGVRATQGGDEVIVHAQKGVVLATGGFGSNIELRQRFNTQWPSLDANTGCTNAPCSTGDGIVMAEAVNANLVDMDFIQLLPYGDAETGSMKGNIVKDPRMGIFLNKEGKRFVNEYARRDVMTLGVYAQTDATMYMVVDGKSYPTLDTKLTFGGTVQSGIDSGKIVMGNTVEELAENLKLDPAVVAETIARYNSAIDNNEPDEVGKTVREKIDTPPYFATTNKPTVHHTMGGVQIDSEARVLDKQGNRIAGLYAAGEVTGDIHGTNRIGGNALTDIIVFGRTAGRNAAAGT